MEKRKMVRLDNASNEKYYQTLKSIIEEGICPFCEPHVDRFFSKKHLYENKDWFIVENAHPYPKTILHLVVILKNHATTPKEAIHAGKSFFEALAWTEKEYNIPGGAFGYGCRFGDIDYTGATVAHLHAQILVPDIHELKEGESVVFYIGKPLKKS